MIQSTPFSLLCAILSLVATAAYAQSTETVLESAQTRLNNLGPDVREVALEPGEYRVSSNGQRAAFVLRGLEDVVIDGNGSTIVVEDFKSAFFIADCRNVTIQNFVLDMDPLPYLQGRVREVDETACSVLVELDKDFAGMEVLKAYFKLKLAVLYDEAGRLLPSQSDCSVSGVGEAGAGIIRVQLSPYDTDLSLADCGYAPGVRMALTGKGQPIIEQHDCSGMVFKNVTVHASAGLAVYERAADAGSVYEDCSIVRLPASDRLLAGNADGFHSSMAVGGPAYLNCEVSSICDDAFAVHGFFSLLLSSLAPDQIEIAPLLRRDFEVGSELNFYDIHSLEPLGSARVTAIESSRDPAKLKAAHDLSAAATREGQRIIRMATEEVLTVTLDREVELPALTLIESEAMCGAGSVVKDCRIDNVRGRAILLQTTDALVERNTVSWLTLPGIEVSGDLPWMQGPFSKNVIVQGNTCEDVGFGLSAKASYKTALGAISLHAYYSGPLKENLYLIQDVLIADNVVRRSGLPGYSVINAEGVTIEGNVFEAVNTLPVRRAGEDLGVDASGNFVVASVADLEVADNEFINPVVSEAQMPEPTLKLRIRK